jgi:hypothetical protein
MRRGTWRNPSLEGRRRFRFDLFEDDVLRVANFEKNERFQLRTSNEEVVRTNALNALKILLVSFSATRYFLVFNRHHSMSIEH